MIRSKEAFRHKIVDVNKPITLDEFDDPYLYRLSPDVVDALNIAIKYLRKAGVDFTKVEATYLKNPKGFVDRLELGKLPLSIGAGLAQELFRFGYAYHTISSDKEMSVGLSHAINEFRILE